MHHIQFWLWLRFRPRWGSSQRSTDPLAGLKGRRRGKGKGGRKKERRKGRKKGKEKEKWEGKRGTFRFPVLS